jgi:hypothetical protein
MGAVNIGAVQHSLSALRVLREKTQANLASSYMQATTRLTARMLCWPHDSASSTGVGT